MDSFFIYLLKVSGILFLFLGSYQLFLKRETFFSHNRVFLVSGLLISFVLPLITITKIRYIDPAPMVMEGVYTLKASTLPIEASVESFSWKPWILLVYLIGVLYFTVKLLLQLRSIHQIKGKSEVVTEENLIHVRTNFHIAPFSFFRSIFYYPKQFNGDELNTILLHEKVHAQGLHTIDILLSEIVFILLWFNPVTWVYKMFVKENLEFLADFNTCTLSPNKKDYQYLLLKQAVGVHKINIVNPFFNSIIKKRIVMLNQNQSKKINSFKLLLVLPLLAFFVYSFNTKEVVKFKERAKESMVTSTPAIDFISPVNPEDIQRISAGFGKVKSPFTQKMEMHKGIDIVASQGKNVLASAAGKVVEAGKNAVNGNFIVLSHKEDYSTRYLHLKDYAVKEGDEVNAGDIIGHVGNTGMSNGPHLHFEVLTSGKAINPSSVVPLPSFGNNNQGKNLERKALKDDRNFEYIINKNTTDAELSKMKEDMKKKGLDFSYTLVRNKESRITSIWIDVKGTMRNNKSLVSNFQVEEEKEIDPVLIKYDESEGTFFIGLAEEVRESKEGEEDDVHSFVFEYKVVNAIIDVDKNSTKEQLEKESDFLAERGVTLDFKGIKTNSKGELTAIKVEYDNGNGEQKTFQQKNTEGIDPFQISVNFDNDGLATIDFLGLENKSNIEIMMPNTSNKNLIWVNDESDQKIIQFDKKGKDMVIVLDGNRISTDSLIKMGKMEKGLHKMMMRYDSVDGEISIDKLEFKKENGYKKIILKDNEKSSTNSTQFIIIEKDSL